MAANLNKAPGVNFEALLRRGVSLLFQGKPEEAVNVLHEAALMHGSDHRAGLALCRAYRRLENHGKAIEALEASLAEKEHHELYLELGSLYEELGSYSHAVEAYRASLRLSDNAECHLKTASAYFHMDDQAGYIGSLRNVLRLEPENTSALNNLAGALAEQGKAKEAIRLYLKSISLAVHPYTYEGLSRAYELSGRQKDAIMALEAALDAGHPLPEELMEKLNLLKSMA